MGRTPRIAFLLDELGGGGAQRSALLTAEAMHAQTARAIVLAAKTGSYAADVPRELPVHLLAPSWPRRRAVATFVWNLQRTTTAERIDAIITNGFGVTRIILLAGAVGLLRGVRVVVVERNTMSLALTDRFESSVARSVVLMLTGWLYRRADAIVGVSDGVSRDLEATLGLPAGSVTTIYNPVDTDRITAAIDEQVPEHLDAAFADRARPVVITTGRLVAQKAHHDLLDAFALLPESHRGSLVILGEGPLRGELEEQAQHLGIADRIWMPGFVDNPWWFIARADVFALSSHWEGHPRALLEALACGVPIASTDCSSGPAEILDNVPNARLTPVGDPASFADSMSDLIIRRNVSAPNIDMRRYAPESVAARYHDAVAQVIAESWLIRLEPPTTTA